MYGLVERGSEDVTLGLPIEPHLTKAAAKLVQIPDDRGTIISRGS